MRTKDENGKITYERHYFDFKLNLQMHADAWNKNDLFTLFSMVINRAYYRSMILHFLHVPSYHIEKRAVSLKWLKG